MAPIQSEAEFLEDGMKVELPEAGIEAGLEFPNKLMVPVHEPVRPFFQHLPLAQ